MFLPVLVVATTVVSVLGASLREVAVLSKTVTCSKGEVIVANSCQEVRPGFVGDGMYAYKCDQAKLPSAAFCNDNAANATCLEGEYFSFDGKCVKVPSGFYNPSSNSFGVFYKCPQSFTSEEGSSSCSPPVGATSCPPGQAPDYNGNCQVCPAGTYSSSGSYCQSCPMGTYSQATGATSSSFCMDCPAGYSCSTTKKTICGSGTYSTGDSTSCSYCPSNTYFPGQGATSVAFCTPCPAGQTSTMGSSSCQ